MFFFHSHLHISPFLFYDFSLQFFSFFGKKGPEYICNDSLFVRFSLMQFREGFSECVNFALLSNDVGVLESLFPLKILSNCVINDDGETIILRALKF
jgi:hypothetical protein